MSTASSAHQPVLYQEIIEALRPQPGGRYVDGTLGAGGHSHGILQASSPSGLLLGLDVDPNALAIAKESLAEFGERAVLRQGSYEQMSEHLRETGWDAVDGIVLDLGASSMQFDRAERGFSFQKEGPLDMRFNPHASTSAADLVNDLPEEDLAELLFTYGEEPKARRVAQAIVKARPLSTTTQLAAVIAKAAGGQRGGIHPATRSFQALRIAVNEELAAIEATLPQAVAALKQGGRLAMISFHSLEDRLVKQYFRRESRDCICPPEQPQCTCGHKASITELSRRPIRPQAAEEQSNPRARSARLRVAEKL
jgi:16S rRNA (cytosine1402-N4)-methyltransferase